MQRVATAAARDGACAGSADDGNAGGDNVADSAVDSVGYCFGSAMPQRRPACSEHGSSLARRLEGEEWNLGR